MSNRGYAAPASSAATRVALTGAAVCRMEAGAQQQRSADASVKLSVLRSVGASALAVAVVAALLAGALRALRCARRRLHTRAW